MKIAVTAIPVTDTTPDNFEVDPRFGRAMCIVMLDTDAGTWSILDNAANYNAVQGAGIQAAESASQAGVDVVITGHCGPKAFRTLAAAGIPVAVGASGRVGDAVRAFQAGDLTATDAPDVESHWS